MQEAKADEVLRGRVDRTGSLMVDVVARHAGPIERVPNRLVCGQADARASHAQWFKDLALHERGVCLCGDLGDRVLQNAVPQVRVHVLLSGGYTRIP